MGQQPDLSPEAWWNPPHMSRPQDLNNVILQEYYMPFTLNKISHKLSKAKNFLKLNAKNGFEAFI